LQPGPVQPGPLQLGPAIGASLRFTATVGDAVARSQ
jgi:hypothetical protein